MKTKANTTTNEKAGTEAAARLEALRKEAAKLEKQLARGTGDVTEEARKVTAPRVGGHLSMDLPQRIEAALRAKPRSIEELARELHETPGRITATMKPMRKHLYNAGTEDAPAWFWIVGDGASASEINAAVEALVKFKPMRFPELLAATGARQGRVSGAIVAMQRDGKSRIANLDSPMRARWFWVPDGVGLARLKVR